MTPEQKKAERLVQRYYDLNKEMTWALAKQLAFIAADEALEALYDAGCRPNYKSCDLWKAVKLEINKL